MPLPLSKGTYCITPCKGMQSNECLAYLMSGALHNLGDVDRSGACPCPTSHVELGVDGVRKPQEQDEHIGVLCVDHQRLVALFSSM